MNRDRKINKATARDGGDRYDPVTPPAGMAWRLNTESVLVLPDRLGLLELWHADDLRRVTRKRLAATSLKPVASEVVHSVERLRYASEAALQSWREAQRRDERARVDQAFAQQQIAAANAGRDGRGRRAAL